MRKTVQTEGAPQKKKHKCLTCLIVCLVVLIVLTAAIIGASAIAFNKFVSPMIGGVKFGQALSLLSGALHANEKKIVTDTYSDQDLDDFYAELNSKTYQTVKSDTQLEQEYNALSPEEQDAMTLTEYKEKNKYTITVGKILDAVGGIEDLINQGGGDSHPSDEGTATAGDVEEGESGSGSGNAPDQEMLNKLIEQLNFDFSPLANYNYLSDEEDESQTTFRVTGKQVAALIGDVLHQVLGSIDLSKYLETVVSGVDISTLDLTKYINIPQVSFVYTEQDPGENATEEQKQHYLRSVKLSATLKMDFNGLLKAPEIKALVQSVAVNMIGKKFVGDLALNAVKMLLPKKLFITAAIYPLDEERDMEVKINNYSEKNQQALSTIIDHFAVEDEHGNKRDVFGTGVEGRGMMGQLNAYVVKAIDGIHDLVPLEFVDSKSGAQLKLAHIQMLLSLMGLYKSDDLEHSITPHMFMTTLRCLLDAAEAQQIHGALAPLYQELEDKYGIDHTYWEDKSLLDTSAMDDLINQIDVTQITFNENEQMKVNVYQDQLASLIADALEKGILTGGETAAAGDEEGDAPDLLKLISFDSLVIANVDAQLDHTDYMMSAWASIDVAKLLGEYIKEESAIVNTLTDALPKGLCFALNVYVRDTWDIEGNVHHTVGKIDVGDGTFVNETGICINKFDQYYTSRVLETIKLMISTLGGGEDSFDISTLSDTIEDAFRQVFSAIEDNLYCSIDLGEETIGGAKKGKLLLPSLYEVVRGFSIKTVEENASLSMDDVLSLSEIRQVFQTLYNYDGAPEQYDEGAADDFLTELEAKYYLTEHWTVDDVMNGNVSDKISADSIDFSAMYADRKPVSQLNVGISPDALADLIGRSGKLNDLDFGSGEDSVISGVEVVNCGYTVSGGQVYLEFICRANLSASSTAAAGDTDGLSIDKLLPRNIYVTGRTLVNSADGYHVDGADDGLPVRFESTVLINENAQAVGLISKLLKVFGDSTIETDTFTSNISSSMEETFQGIEDNINLVYGNTEETALSLANIFNTINKNSHKDDAAYNAQSQALKEADDQKLADLMREVGRNPAFSTGTGDKEGIVTSLQVATFSADLVYGKSDEDAFFDDVNANFYIAQGHEITAQALNEGYEIDSDSLDFQGLYGDDRDYDDLKTAITSKRFAALANAIYDEGIEVNGVGTAKILQVKINEDSLDLLIQVHNTQTDDTGKIMPTYLYVTSSTSLVANDLGVKDYATTCQINNLSGADTSDFIDRLNLLKAAFTFEFDLTMDTITKPIQDSIQELFDDKLEPFGTIKIEEDAINLPTVFGIINERSHKDDDPAVYGYNDWDEADKDLDDRQLCVEMREVGRNPAFTTGVDNDHLGIVTSLSVETFSAGLVYGKSDETAFFQDINANFYIADGQEITAAKLNADFEINNDTLDFHKLYADTRTYGNLHTALTNKRFAALANALYTDGIAVDDIGTAKILQVSISEESIQLLVQVHNTQTDDTAKVMPEYLYITSQTSLVATDELGVKTYETTCQINDLTYGNTGDFIDRINLLKAAFELEFNIEMETITKPISDNIKELFEDKLEPFGTIEIVDGQITLPTIFGIINERSHKDDVDPTGYNTWSDADKDADDRVLCVEMREMGRNPIPTYNTGANSDIVWELDVQNFLDYQSYTHADEDAFFATVNRNFYIADGQDITAAKINDQNFSIGNDVVSFRKLYADTREYSELTTVINNKHFAALANSLYTDGITVDDIGVAKILQVQIAADSLQLLVQVHVTETGDTAKILPEYLYVTSVTSLLDGDNYATTCAINDMDYLVTDGTVDFIDTRLGLIKTAFELEFTVSTATIVGPIADNIQELFEDKINTFGNVTIEVGQISLPTVFAFLVDGSYADKEVQADYIMYAMDEDGFCYLKDGEVYLDDTNWRYLEDDSLYVGDASHIIFFNNQGVKHYYPEESRISRVEEMHTNPDTHEDYSTYPLYLPGTTTEVDADLVLRQDPEILMYSLREFGKADAVSLYANNIYVWKDHAPSTVNDKYNTNRVSEEEETAFYQRLQGYYFFKNTPDSSWFDSASNIFDDLKTDFDNTFNLEAASGTRTYSSAIPTAEQAILEEHFTNGLYHYDGDRQQVMLTDQAMGMIVNKQNVLAGAGLPSNIQSMTVTAFKLNVDPGDSKIMTIEITTEVISKDKDSEHEEQSGEALPTKFYITTTTVRNDNLVGSARYSTGVSINGMQPKDVKRLLNNIDVLSSFDLSSQLDLDKIAKNVEDALKELLDQKLDKYVAGYESGGMRFHSIYHQVAENMGYDITKYNYGDNTEAYAEEDIQHIIVKLHDVTEETSFNPQSAAYETERDPDHFIPDWIRTSDKAFGNSLSQMIESEPTMTDYIDILQAVFFTGDYSLRNWDSAHWEFWEEMIAERNAGFAFGSANTYILVSAKVDLNVASDVSFVPTYMHVTLVIDESKHADTDPLLFDDVIINDLTAREQQLLMATITDTDGKLASAKADMITKIQQAFGTLYVAGYDISYEQATSIQDWVGVLVATKQ